MASLARGKRTTVIEFIFLRCSVFPCCLKLHFTNQIGKAPCEVLEILIFIILVVEAGLLNCITAIQFRAEPGTIPHEAL
jgi:phosphatidylglycerophosphate synthase